MASGTGAALFAAGLSPVSRRICTPIAGKSRPACSISPIAVSTKQAPALKFERFAERGLRDYFEQAREMMTSSSGGPPRWFSPLDCAPPPSPPCDAPLLLYLPGDDGVGLGLVMHHEKLAQMFEVWCLDIPIMDRTPFTELVKLVEKTVRSEHCGSPNRPIYLVGESLGGCLALAVAARNPDIDLVLVLANPATSFNQSLLQPLVSLLEIMPANLAYLSLTYVLSIMTGNTLGTAVATVSKGLPLQQAVEELSLDLAAISSYLSVWAGTFPNEALLWKLKMLKVASAYANSRLHAVNAQTLILSSGRDQLLPSQEECERLLHAMPKCTIRQFPDSGHFLFLDSGVDLVTVIKGASFYRRSKCHDYVSDYMPPTPSELKRLRDSYQWLYTATSPVMMSTLESGKIVRGLAGIPSEGPVLLVGYHSLLGLDLIPLALQSSIERNIIVRGIAHPLIFTKLGDVFFPDVSKFDMFRVMGAVPVSAINFFKLLTSKSHVLLYPGGMREALHRKGEEYKLFWPEQSEFVRLAAKFGAKIVPFGVVGEDRIGELVVDYDDYAKIPVCKARIEKMTNNAVKLRDKAFGEVADQYIHLPLILPKFPGGRYYYYFGKPIETEGRKNELRDREKCHELYLQVKSEVETCLAYLKEKRGSDPYRDMASRVLYQVTHGFESEIPTFKLDDESA